MVNNPNIRFTGFADEWVQRKLGDYLTKSIEIKAENPSEIELLTVQLHHKGIIASGKMPKVTSKGRSYFVRHVGELIIGRQNFHNGGFGIAKSDVNGLIASSAIQSFDFKDNINPFFLISLMQRSDWLGRTEVFIGGTGQKEYSANVLLNLKIESTTLKEQQKIGSVFSTLDHKIGLEERQIELLKDLKKGYLQKMFPKNGAKVPELRFAGFANDWEERKFKEFSKKTGKKNSKDLDFPAYSVSNKAGLISQTEQFDGSRLDNLEKTTYKFVEPNEFAYNPARINVGSIAFNNLGMTVIVSSLYVVVKMSEDLDNEFILQFIKSPTFIKEVKRNTEGSVREYLFYENFANIKFPFTRNKEEQQKIGNFFKQLDDTIALHQRKLDLLKDLKKGLSQQMFV